MLKNLYFPWDFWGRCEDLCRYNFLNKTTIYTWLLFSAKIYILMELVNDLVNVRIYLELVINTCIFCSDKHNGVRGQFFPLSHLLVNYAKLKFRYKWKQINHCTVLFNMMGVRPHNLKFYIYKLFIYWQCFML